MSKLLFILASVMLITACASKISTQGSTSAENAASTTADSTATASKDIHRKEIKYQHNGVKLTGYLAYDATIKTPRPGVLVVHEWWGHNDYARKRAEQLAKLGYVALAVDMYGDGKVAAHPNDAKKFMLEVMSNTDNAMQRFSLAKALLQKQPITDADKIAAIGYCFGGAVVLNAVRSGIDLDAAVSFHGGLSAAVDMTEGKINTNTKVLVLNGEADPFVPAEQIKSFRSEMDAAGVDYELINYPGVKHSFTNPAATAVGEQFNMPLLYNQAADQDSWQKMQALFNTVF